MINSTNEELSREFLCFFVVDQSEPLFATKNEIPIKIEKDFDKRVQLRDHRLVRQLQPAGKFGISSENIYSTGNGSAALLGWIGNLRPEDVKEIMQMRSNLDRRGLMKLNALNISPPINRGISWSLEDKNVNDNDYNEEDDEKDDDEDDEE